MHAVVVTRVRGLVGATGGYRDAPRAHEEPPREELVRALAALTQRDAADWRMRVGQPLPWVVATEPDADRALALVVALRGQGLGAVGVDWAVARAWAPRGHATLLLGESELGFLEDARRVPYAAVRVAVLATLDTETSTEEVEKVVVASRHRNLPSTMSVSHYVRQGARSRALYLGLDAGQPDVCLVQGAVRLESSSGLGAAGSTSLQRFERVLEALLPRMPGVILDERLLAARRGRTGFATRADGLMHTTSNVRETDLVARAIGVAWREGQIDPFEPSTAAQSFSSSRSGA